MTSSKYRGNTSTLLKQPQSISSLLLIGLLSACSDSGLQSGNSNSGTVGESSSSSSADQLASQNGGVVTIGNLLAIQEQNGSGGLSPVGGPAAANPDSVDSEASGTPQTSFSSDRTSGFTGEVLDDAIRITWQAHPGADGYNLYRQGEYYTTVDGTEFLDESVFDDDYYYEVQAFNSQSNEFTDIARGLTVSPRTFGTTDPNAPQPDDQLLEDYALVFADEFNGVELDTSKWNTAFLWGTDVIINTEEQYYVDINNEPDFGYNPFSFDGENLVITTIETPSNLVSEANDQPYLSGIITSYDAFKFTYGYVETRAKLPYGRGYWPAFWLLNAYYGDSDGQPADPEIDIMEYIGHELDAVHHTYHYFDSEGQLRSTPSNYTKGIDFTSDFHTFAVEWAPDILIFYVDGIERYRIVDTNVSSEEMYVLANTAVGGWWAGSPDETTPFPNTYEIDYIRVYQKTTPLEDLQLDQPDHVIPLFDDNPTTVTPAHRPTFEQWPAHLR